MSEELMMKIDFKRGEELISSIHIPSDITSEELKAEKTEEEIKDLFLEIAAPLAHQHQGLEAGDKLFVNDEWVCEITEKDIQKMDESPLQSDPVDVFNLPVEERKIILKNMPQEEVIDLVFRHIASIQDPNIQGDMLKSLPKVMREFFFKCIKINFDETLSPEDLEKETTNYDTWKQDVMDAEEPEIPEGDENNG